MAYDPSLDNELEKRELDIDGQVFEVSLRSYNGGEPKLLIQQKNGRFPVRRLTPRQFLAIAEIVRGMAETGPAS